MSDKPGSMLMWFRRNALCEEWAMEQTLLKMLTDAEVEEGEIADEGRVSDYTKDELIADYTQLLVRLTDLRGEEPRKRAFIMQTEFARLAVAYSGLFSVACHRAVPPDLPTVLKLLVLGQEREKGEIAEAKARGIVMDIAEGCRRKSH
ncbi:hypothetical protein JKP88DRAFT_272890 [Tribonema minus]|uniref:Uncharacterized protein n=1 Tax=Tribonema minus TaxID=303371 RepID=A0A835YY29_9STRA|nr:hypothetical protein JKP88DRAFT_272890 [Tribonema minus]